MGLYLSFDAKGCRLPLKGKAQALLSTGAAELGRPTTFQPWMICVVDNGDFEAAGFAYSYEELIAFARPDGRPKRWLVAEAACRKNFLPEILEEHEDQIFGLKVPENLQPVDREKVVKILHEVFGPDIYIFEL